MYQKASHNITGVVRGDTFHRIIKIVDSKQNTAFDFTGWTAKMQVRSNRADPPQIELLSTAGEIILTAGQIQLNKDATSMQGIIAGNYLYDIEFTNPVSEVYTLLSGVLSVTDDITY